MTATAKKESYINNQAVVMATEIESRQASAWDYGKWQQEN